MDIVVQVEINVTEVTVPLQNKTVSLRVVYHLQRSTTLHPLSHYETDSRTTHHFILLIPLPATELLVT